MLEIVAARQLYVRPGFNCRADHRRQETPLFTRLRLHLATASLERQVAQRATWPPEGSQQAGGITRGELGITREDSNQLVLEGSQQLHLTNLWAAGISHTRARARAREQRRLIAARTETASR